VLVGHACCNNCARTFLWKCTDWRSRVLDHKFFTFSEGDFKPPHVPAKHALGLDPRVESGSPTRTCANTGIYSARECGSCFRAVGSRRDSIRPGCGVVPRSGQETA
jgi:hypothetical protein